MAKGLPLRASDLRGLALLGRDAVVGITDLVEQMHLTILRHPHPVGAQPTGRTRGITGLVYRSVRGITGLVGWSIDNGLRAVGALAGQNATEERAARAEREAMVAAVNGIWGDHLVATHNPLAIRMALRSGGVALPLEPDRLRAQLAAPTGRVLVLLHGLCMNDLQWQRNGHEHGQALAAAGYTPLYLHYNSGRRIADNGRGLAALLEELLAAWPVPVRELVLLGHSMGGLVARSACIAAQAQGLGWLGQLSRIACLGTPHHGAALERGGRLVDAVLEISPYVAPLARLGRSRSAGINDLRFGHVQDADRDDTAARDARGDQRRPAPSPAGVKLFAVAGRLARNPDKPGPTWVGDGLVAVDSALGRHADAGLALGLPGTQQLTVDNAGHFDLLDHPQVAAQLLAWLGPEAR